MTSRQLRLLRAVAASSTATVVAATSHTVAGGPAPHPLLVLALAAFLISVAALLVGPRASRLRTAATVIVSQGVFHLVFQVLGAPAGGGAMPAVHAHHLPALGSVAIAAMPDAPMLAGHALAAAVTTFLLWHGEGIAAVVARWVRAVLRRAETVLPAPNDPPLPLRSDDGAPSVALSASSVSRRGPPAVA
ncbi:hypothetical protein [Microbacterium sp. XT11]|uniref:hypothetical protein n=1 Tax=Microbacterium sp. XT11 TaxID=367477 RepID=UPI0008298DC7|nr:hypothetical protein [Microbacterium sp. XT11]